MFFKRFKEKANKLNNDNRGLSLVELIVTVLLMGVISGMIVMFISSSRANYEIISTESTLQGEAQAATGFIYDILLEAEDVYFYGKDVPIDAERVGGSAGEGTVKVLSAKNGDTYSVVLYEIDEGKLRYTSMSAIEAEVTTGGAIDALKARVTANPNDKLLGDKYSLLAEHVTGLNFEQLKNPDPKINLSYSNVNLDFEFAGRKYHTTIDVNGRNSKEER